MYSHFPSARQAGHAVTGATGILLFYRLGEDYEFTTLSNNLINRISLLPDKKKKFPSEDEEETCGSCRVKNVEDIPDDIMEATRYTHLFL